MNLDDLHKYIQESQPNLVANFLKENPGSVTKTDNDGRTPLMWSLSEAQSTEVVSEILKYARNEKSFDINTADNAGLTALHIAASIGPPFTKQILDLKPLIDCRTNSGQTPLVFSVSKQKYECAELLLESGASARSKDGRQVTALMRAAALGDLRLVKLLLRKGAVVNATDATGWSCVHYAFSEGRSEVLDFLADSGGDFNKLSKDEEKPADVAPLGFKYVQNK